MELDPNHDGKITHEEFVLILKYIEQKQQALPPINGSVQKSSSNLGQNSIQGGDLSSRSGGKFNHSTISAELSVYELDKKKYGALLPKTGVYFLPDERVVAFLK